MNIRTSLATSPPFAAYSTLEWCTDPAQKTAHLAGGSVNDAGQRLAMCNHIYPPHARDPKQNDRYCPCCVDVAVDCGIEVPKGALCLTRRAGSLLWIVTLITVLTAVTIWAITPIF
jgi:hypothetical protein